MVESEVAVLEELEELLGRPIPPVTEFDFRSSKTWFGFIAENTHVTELALCAQGLSSLPASLGTLDNLRQLSLTSNQLQALPEAFGELQSLQRLYLWKNRLHSRPESVAQLQNLQELYLEENQFRSLPESVCQLQALRTLYLEGNLIQFLESDSLTCLSNSICPFCGTSSLVSGRDKETGKERKFCPKCENNIL
ncbi:MAG: leucine-rich repeat domain-containing protein [Candidatus Hodarchaeota archaeon]